MEFFLSLIETTLEIEKYGSEMDKKFYSLKTEFRDENFCL